jgi:divinyl protochlorophyllide a 8-vinyl-reductase
VGHIRTSIDRTSVEGPARIGPNAATQLIPALHDAGLDGISRAVFAAAGVPDWLMDPPGAMVDEIPVGRLHRGLRAALPDDAAAAVMRQAGRRTADYLLAARIPHAAQFVLKLLPAALAARVLVPAIRAHAWTFAGSGRFTARVGRTVVFEVVANPLCAHEHSDTPVCAWHAAVFERLFQVLVSPRSRVTETDCAAAGAACCRFVVDWRAGSRTR